MFCSLGGGGLLTVHLVGMAGGGMLLMCTDIDVSVLMFLNVKGV